MERPEDSVMTTFSAGFNGRHSRGPDNSGLPPGQYLTRDFPVLSAGPTPQVPLDTWRLEVSGDEGVVQSWNWDEFRALAAERITVGIHCVTRWSKLGTTWTGVPVDVLLADVEIDGEFVVASSYGGYTTNLPLEDLLDGKAWAAFEYEGEPLDPEHGGPARLLVPHLYLWKSAKWLRGLRLQFQDEPGFWEQLGYHNYGDPRREQRHWGD
jgi:DMSO/TMAO reductase YedYZ molybdopterin-dependent catalytic subunit